MGCTAPCSKLSHGPSGQNTKVLSKMMGSPMSLVRSASRNGPTNRLSDKNLWACPRNHHSPPGEPGWSLAGLIVRTVCRCAHVYAGWCRPLMSGRPPVFLATTGRRPRTRHHRICSVATGCRLDLWPRATHNRLGVITVSRSGTPGPIHRTEPDTPAHPALQAPPGQAGSSRRRA